MITPVRFVIEISLMRVSASNRVDAEDNAVSAITAWLGDRIDPGWPDAAVRIDALWYDELLGWMADATVTIAGVMIEAESPEKAIQEAQRESELILAHVPLEADNVSHREEVMA